MTILMDMQDAKSLDGLKSLGASASPGATCPLAMTANAFGEGPRQLYRGGMDISSANPGDPELQTKVREWLSGRREEHASRRPILTGFPYSLPISAGARFSRNVSERTCSPPETHSPTQGRSAEKSTYFTKIWWKTFHLLSSLEGHYLCIGGDIQNERYGDSSSESAPPRAWGRPSPPMGFSPTAALAEVRAFKLARATETRNTCPYCSVSCGVLIYTTGDKSKERPWVDHPHRGRPGQSGEPRNALSQGAGLKDMIHSANRLKWPEVREGGHGGMEADFWSDAFDRIAKHMKADRDANFMAQNADGVTINRWTSTGYLASSAAQNEVGYLTVKTLRALGITSLDTQARI